MALVKKLLFSGIGLVAIAGIGTGIGVAINNSRTVESSINETESKPNEGNKNPETPIQPAMVDLKKLVEEIKPENIIFKKQTVAAQTNPKSALTTNESNDGRKDVYAFDVKTTELDFDEATKKKLAESKVKVEIKLNNTNNGVELNKGNLNLNLVGSFLENKEAIEKANMMQTHQIKLEGFKAIDTILSAYLNAEGDDSLTAVLDLSKVKKSSNTIALTTIEDLNKQTPASPKARTSLLTSSENEQTTMVLGLTKLFQNVKEPEMESADMNYKNVSVIGKVKLEKITKDTSNQTTLFHLVSTENNQPLKLSLKSETTKEALVNEIVVTNLLATKIAFDFSDFENDEKQTEFVNKYKNEATNKKFESYKDGQGLSLKIKKMTDSDDAQDISVIVKPTLLKRLDKKQDIKANLVITYGSENGSKIYKTSKIEDIKELKDAGISFEIYSKKLTDGMKYIEAVKITEKANKLSTFFNKDAIEKGVDKNVLKENDNMMPIGMFKLISTSDINFKKDFVLGQVTSSSKASSIGPGLDVEQENWDSENWISFVGYTFNKGLKDKVLFFPQIDLIHIEEIKAKPIIESDGVDR